MEYDEELFNALYNAKLPDGRVIHYCRELLYMGSPPRFRQQMRVLAPIVGPLTKSPMPGPKILIVGCGFSPLLDLDPDIIGTDPSPYIQEHKETEVGSPEKVYPYTVPYDIPESWHGRFDFVITDDVLPGLESTPSPSQPQTEAHEFLEECSAMGERVIHFVTSDIDEPDHPLFTYHSLEEWSEFAPDHVWVRDQTMEVIWPH